MEVVDNIEARALAIQAARVEKRRSEQKNLPNPALLWMALGPGWTASLAQLAGFPSDNIALPDLFERIVATGLAKKTIPTPTLNCDGPENISVSTPEPVYTCGSEAIQSIYGIATDATTRTTQLNGCLRDIVGGFRKAQSNNAQIPPPILKWIELAGHFLNAPEGVKDFLLEQVERALSHADTSEAVAWVEAAFPLERAFAGNVSLAVRVGGLRVQLYQRREGNLQYLKRFLMRGAQVDAFRALLADNVGWALHYSGSGGVGKTMLMRYLEHEVAPEVHASTARIDFDYLNPEYPTTKPALLLVELATELRLSGRTDEATTAFQSFFDKAQTLHERIGTETQPISPIDRIRDVEFGFLMDAFARAVKLLPQPVVLLLDTCEELAKMTSDGQLPQGVLATYEILEQLRGRMDTLRVIFSGRRPLASSGFGGWRALKPADQKLPPRSYLRLYEVRAFNEEDARRFLQEKCSLAKEFADAILPHCLEKGYAPLYAGVASSGTGSRYSPFELWLYASWAMDTSVTPKEIEGTALDQYVRTRIVGRIENRRLRNLLPVIAWMGEVDAEVLARLSGLLEDSSEVRDLVTELERQEWVDARRSPVLTVEPALRRRMLDYFRSESPADYETARQTAATQLEALTNTAVRDLSVTHLEAALEALQDEPERAAEWWQKVHERIAQGNDYGWILDPLGRLLADDHWPKDPNARHIRAAVAATLAAAQLHNDRIEALRETTHLIEQNVDRYPDETAAHQLRLIAMGLRGEIGDYGQGALNEDTVSAMLTGISRSMQDGNTASWLSLPLLAEAISDQGCSKELLSFGCMLAGKGLALQGSQDEAGSWYRKAFGMAALFERPLLQRWPYWISPQNLASRLRLEFLAWAYPGNVEPQKLDWWFVLPNEIHGLDDDRLASAVVGLKGALKPLPFSDPPTALIGQSRQTSLADDLPAPVHQGYDPFFSVVALEMAYAGHVEAALDLLSVQSVENESVASSFSDTLASDRAFAEIVCRFRLDRPIPDSLSRSTEVGDRVLVWSMRSLGKNFRSFEPESGNIPELNTARWITSVATDVESGKVILDWARQSFVPGEFDLRTFAGASRALDLMEANELAKRFELPAVGNAPEFSTFESAVTPLDAAFMVNLRMWALGLRKEFPSDLVDRLGSRAAALIALQLGELLAIRLPKQGFLMLEFAANSFDASADAVLKTIAATCCAMAAIRLRDKDSINRWVKIIQDQFQEGKSAFLPSENWARIIEISKQNPMGKGEALDWTWPWIVRIALCVATDFGWAGEIFGNPTVPPEFSGSETILPLGLPEPVSALPRIEINKRSKPPEPSPALEKILRLKCTPKLGAPVLDLTQVRLFPFTGNMIQIMTPSATLPYRTNAIPAVRSFSDTQILELDRACAWVNWESILDPDGKHFYRRRVEGITPPPGFNWNDVRYLTLSNDFTAGNLAGSAFGKTQGWSFVEQLEELKSSEHSASQVLHIVCDALETSSGVRLSLRSLERSKVDRGQLIRPADLMEMLPTLRMCVLQPPIAREVQRRTEVDREKASYFRAFAAELQAAGCGIVITLPNLEWNFQVRLLGAIADTQMNFSSSATDVVPFFTALGEQRSQLLNSLPPDFAEAAFDICYFG
jgi:hypothetical protein